MDGVAGRPDRISAWTTSCFSRARPFERHWRRAKPFRYTGQQMDAEQTISEIQSLERMYAVPDTRPLTPSDVSAANRRHDQKLASSPWFRLWQDFGICCRPNPPVLQLGED